MTSRFALSAGLLCPRGRTRSACRARSASRTFTSAFFNLMNILDSARYSSQPLFRERRISAALAEFLECPSWLVLRPPNVRRNPVLKISIPSIPGWQTYVVSHITQAPADNCRFHKNISVNAMPSGGPPPRPSATSPPTSPSTRFASIEPTTAQPQAQFQLSACSALLGYLIVEVSQMEVLWPLAVSVGSPEVVSVMRPADFNSGIPFLTVFALPTLIFN